jgi:hypothetical protein
MNIQEQAKKLAEQVSDALQTGDGSIRKGLAEKVSELLVEACTVVEQQHKEFGNSNVSTPESRRYEEACRTLSTLENLRSQLVL